MLSRQTRAAVDHVSPLLPFPFRNDAMRANVGSGSGWNATTAVISEFLPVRSLQRHFAFYVSRVCQNKIVVGSLVLAIRPGSRTRDAFPRSS